MRFAKSLTEERRSHSGVAIQVVALCVWMKSWWVSVEDQLESAVGCRHEGEPTFREEIGAALRAAFG